MKRFLATCVLVVFASPLFGDERPVPKLSTVSTFSIVAIDPANGDMGVAVASRYFSVGSVVPWALAGVGAVAMQANVNVGYGPKGIDLLREGLSARQVLDRLLAEDTFEGKDGRQVAIVDAHGNIATYTGPSAPHWAGDRQGKTWSAQGNILVGPQVPESMGRHSMPHRASLRRSSMLDKAGDDAGGDARGHPSTMTATPTSTWMTPQTNRGAAAAARSKSYVPLWK